MNDITKYSDNELSLLVFNTESLYEMRNKRGFIDLLKERFKYTPTQFKVLSEDLIEDRKQQ